MSRANFTLAACLALAFACPQPALAAWTNDVSINTAVAAPPGIHDAPSAVPDGAGGMFISWMEVRGGSYDVIAQHLNAAGTPLWAATGAPVFTGPSDQETPLAVADGQGGLFVLWTDFATAPGSLRAQHLNGAGAPLWPAAGVLVSATPNAVTNPTMLPDGSGGLLVGFSVVFSPTDDDVYVQRISAAGVVQWGLTGITPTSATSKQDRAQLVPNLNGGWILTWTDNRVAPGELVYGQWINTAGTFLWTAGGQLLSNTIPNSAAGNIVGYVSLSDGVGGVDLIVDTDGGSFANYVVSAAHVTSGLVRDWGITLSSNSSAAKTNLGAVPDGRGGLYVAWQDVRSGYPEVYLNRVTGSGVIPVGWQVGGDLVASGGFDTRPVIAADGLRGVIVAWDHSTNGSTRSVLRAARIDPAGNAVAGWPTFDGATVSTAAGLQDGAAVGPDGNGGAIFVIDASVGSLGTGVYAQNLDRYGQPGDASPHIVNVRDYPNDQGGKVRLEWTASYLDAAPYSAIGSYLLWRQAPPFAPGFAAAPGTPATLRPGSRRITRDGAQTYFWELVTSLNAQGFAGYSAVVTTGSDSIGAGNPYTRFMVEARHTYLNEGWSSAPDSGYSLDNIPPVTPAPFTGQYAVGTARLHWNPNPDPDFALYRLHRGLSPAFVPSPANLVASPADTGFVDAAGQPYFYKLAAEDAHGNRSGYALLQPSGTLGVAGGETPSELALSPPGPNPTRGPANFAFALPRVSNVRLEIADAAGRIARVLCSGAREAGTYTIAWDGTDGSGQPLPSGLYFARLDASGHARTRRFTVLR